MKRTQFINPTILPQVEKNGKGPSSFFSLKYQFLSFFSLLFMFTSPSGLMAAQGPAQLSLTTSVHSAPMKDEAGVPQIQDGCEENALCGKEMGQHLLAWKDMLKKLHAQKNLSSKELAQNLEKFRQTSGIPVEFYSNLRAYKQFSPLLWDSPCKIHQNEDKNKQVFVAMSFVKDARGGPGQIIHQGVVHFVPRGELFQLDPLIIYDPEQMNNKNVKNKNHKIKYQTFFVPRGEIPLAMKSNQIIIPREDEGIYYYLEINQKGDFKIAKEQISKQLAEDDEVECDAEIKKFWQKNYSTLYSGSFCRQIWDQASKKKKHMLVSWSCQ